MKLVHVRTRVRLGKGQADEIINSRDLTVPTFLNLLCYIGTSTYWLKKGNQYGGWSWSSYARGGH